MPRARHKVEWCLKKAEKELKEAGRHRGLRKITTRPETIRKHIMKAEHNLKAISAFKNIGYSDWSASAAFYSIYHCLLALISKQGYESRNQECTFALVYDLIENGQLALDKSIIEGIHNLDLRATHESPTITEIREARQYGVELSLPTDTYEWLLKTTKTILDKTKEIAEE